MAIVGRLSDVLVKMLFAIVSGLRYDDDDVAIYQPFQSSN